MDESNFITEERVKYDNKIGVQNAILKVRSR